MKDLSNDHHVGNTYTKCDSGRGPMITWSIIVNEIK